MNTIFKFLLFLLPILGLQAQIHEVGVFLGGSNYIGDIGSTSYISPNKFAYGVVYKWNKSPRHAFRFSYAQSQISATDANSTGSNRKLRGYSFENNIKEIAAGLEFNFFDFNLHDARKKITPYVYSGINYFMHDELYIIAGETSKSKSSNSFAIPMVVGLKSNLSKRMILAFEVGARYTFTDGLDGNNPKNNNAQIAQFGNINNNDWYVFSGFMLTYTFGNKPCYCAE
jgi:hypothetical protein